MSFYSYKNANAECSPGVVNGNILTGLNQRVCIQVKNVYDSALSQEQLEDKKIVVTDIVPVLPGDTPEELAARVLVTEHRILAEGLRIAIAEMKPLEG